MRHGAGRQSPGRPRPSEARIKRVNLKLILVARETAAESKEIKRVSFFVVLVLQSNKATCLEVLLFA